MIYKIKDYLEIQFWRVALWLLIRGYGEGCTTKDTDDFPELKDTPRARCASCKAKETQDWIREHIELLKSYI